MNWMPKVRVGGGSGAHAATKTAAATAPAISSAANTRISNGLKEFLWLLSDMERGRVLDLGPAWQSTISFFTEKGFRISTEDLLRSWKDWLTTEEDRMRKAAIGDEGERLSADILAERFLQGALQYPAESFHGMLAWDLLDYVEAPLSSRVMDRLYHILRPGGVVLALFHSRPAERFYRYRIAANQSIELIAAPPLAMQGKVFQNRQILDLFGQFRSSRTFVGRDQLREGLFLK